MHRDDAAISNPPVCHWRTGRNPLYAIQHSLFDAEGSPMANSIFFVMLTLRANRMDNSKASHQQRLPNQAS